MGLFDKKYCDVCGEKIGVLGNRKLEDGNLCKNCVKKLSPFFDDRRHSTIEKIKEQLEYRQQNEEVLKVFHPTRTLGGDAHKLYIDEQKGQFVVARKLNDGANHDVINLSQVRSCSMEVEEHKKADYKDRDGDGDRDFNGYDYSYDYYVWIQVDSPWFDEIKMEMNVFQIDEHNHPGKHKAEAAAREIVNYFQNKVGMNNGMNMNPNMQYGQMQQNQINNRAWNCPACGTANSGRFCENCGTPRN